jgi:ABC-type transport system involved in multi-copper enzyme maturation permease subunit
VILPISDMSLRLLFLPGRAHPLFAIVLHTLRAARRDMLFIGTVLALVVTSAVAFFMGSTALVEQLEMKVVYTSTISRIVTLVGMMIFICFHLKCMFDNREIDMIVSRPISRPQVVGGLFLGFTALSVPIIMLLVVILLPFANKLGLLFWALSVLLESWVVVSFSMFFALLIRGTVFSLLMSIMTYTIARVIGSFIAYISITRNIKELHVFQSLAEFSIKVLSVVLPRLDLCGKSSWLIYGVQSDMRTLIYGMLQSLIFTLLILSATIYDFCKKDL